MCQDQSLKAGHNDGCEYDRAAVIQTGVFWHWDNGGGFKACWHSCLSEGQIENICKNTCELLHTCFKQAPREVHSPVKV